MPMMPPKDALVALTGGYRGTPVLQIGADVYIDSQLIALELERRFPSPTLFPGASRGCPLMLVKWSDAFFRTTLVLAVEQTARQWPESFLADRKHLFHDFDWEGRCTTRPTRARNSARMPACSSASSPTAAPISRATRQGSLTCRRMCSLVWRVVQIPR